MQEGDILGNWVIVIIVLFSLALIFPSNIVGYETEEHSATEEHSVDKFEQVDTVTSSEAKAIPSWVNQNFVWYKEELITQSELLNTLKYLLDINIIFTSDDADAHQKASGMHQTITPHTDSDERNSIETILNFLGGLEKSIHEMEGHAGEEHFVAKFGFGGTLPGIQEIAKSTLNVGGPKTLTVNNGPSAEGTFLPKVMSANVCGNTLCDTPMSIEEKIKMHLQSLG